MEKGEFLFLLLGASYADYKATIELKKQNLVASFKYNVRLGGSHTDNADTDFTVYPEDQDVVHNGITDAEVVNLLLETTKCQSGLIYM